MASSSDYYMVPFSSSMACHRVHRVRVQSVTRHCCLPLPLPHYAALLACRIDSLLTHSHDEVSSMHTAAIPIARWLCAGVAWLFFDCHYVNVPIVFVFNLLAALARAPWRSAYGSHLLLDHQRQ